MQSAIPIREGRLGASESAVGNALTGKFMTFKLADEEYGLAILNVREIIGLMEITRVPRTKSFIRGVINLRGKVIPVVDLRCKFGMERIEATEQTVIIVVQCDHGESTLTMGILVDEVLEVLNIEASQIEPSPDFGVGASDTSFILGIGRADKRVIFLLDIARVLTVQDRDAIDATERKGPGVDGKREPRPVTENSRR